MAVAYGRRILVTSDPVDFTGNYTFTHSGGRASAGVYNDQQQLIRTLFSGEQINAGTHTKNWDGLLDDGTDAPVGSYSIKVLSNNVSYVWEGANIGNTSTALTGATKHRAAEAVTCMAVAGNKVYTGHGYNEVWTAQQKFNTSTPQSKTHVGRLFTNDLATYFVATDGNRVYWAGLDPYDVAQTLVFATEVANDALVDFGSNGTLAKMEEGGFYSALSYKNETGANISGLAVQQSEDYLFVARSAKNELQVLNKTTGALVQTLTINGAAGVGIDRSGFLWLSHQSELEKYTINSNGTLTSTSILITTMLNIGGFDFSPDGSIIAVCDLDNQVVRGFSTADGSLLWTLGTPGGYLTDASVNDYKFYFKDVRNIRFTSIAYLADGSFYVTDPGNCRLQHYDADRLFIDRIMYMPQTYKTSVDKSNPTRLYANFMEFEIDYSQPLATCWTLKNNWEGNFTIYNYFSKIFNPITFPNGRVYSLVQVDAVHYYVIELVQNGVIRYTDIEFGQRAFIGTDGSKIQPTVGAYVVWNRYPLTGYDGNNNPIWSTTPEVLASVPFNEYDPEPANNMYEFPITASDKIMFFDARRRDGLGSNDYHLGAVNRGSTDWAWKTARGTENGYSGPLPEDGYFDNGNGVEGGGRAGGSALINNIHIFWAYHGEFWKQSQTNIWNHVDANTGLFVGQFGVITKDFPKVEAFAGGAGNVFEGTVVTVNGIMYLYINDEGVNNGVHRWRIDGLNTINLVEATMPVLNPVERLPGEDLMRNISWGLNPFPNNFNGWNRTPATDETGWQVTTGVKCYDRFKKPDIHVRFNKGVNNFYSLERALNNVSTLASWRLFGRINWDGNTRTQAQLKAGSYLEILDNAGKVIARLDLRQQVQGDELSIIGNDKTLANTFSLRENQRFHSIEISKSSGTLTFKFGGFTQTTTNVAEAGANVSKPATLRLYFFTGPNGGGDAEVRAISVTDLRFVKN